MTLTRLTPIRMACSLGRSLPHFCVVLVNISQTGKFKKWSNLQTQITTIWYSLKSSFTRWPKSRLDRLRLHRMGMALNRINYRWNFRSGDLRLNTLWNHWRLVKIRREYIPAIYASTSRTCAWFPKETCRTLRSRCPASWMFRFIIMIVMVILRRNVIWLEEDNPLMSSHESLQKNFGNWWTNLELFKK